MSYEEGKADNVQSPKINFYVFSQGIHPPPKKMKNSPFARNEEF